MARTMPKMGCCASTPSPRWRWRRRTGWAPGSGGRSANDFYSDSGLEYLGKVRRRGQRRWCLRVSCEAAGLAGTRLQVLGPSPPPSLPCKSGEFTLAAYSSPCFRFSFD